MNAQTAHTPRTDAEADDPYSIHLMNGRAERHDVEGRKQFGLKLIPFVVDIDFARTLERENAQLVEHNERMRDALGKIAHFDWSAAATQRDACDTMQRIARAALNPPPTT